MSELHEVYADVALGCIALAAVFAVPGWLLNRPDGSRRCTWRLLTWLALVGLAMSWIARDDHRAWWHWALDVLILWMYYSNASRTWKQLEKWRKAERLLPRLKATR